MAYTISSDSSVGITLTNASYSPLSVNANVTVANGTALSAIGNGGNYTWTIDNSGTITGGGAGNSGIVLGGPADLVAHGDITNEAVGIISGDTFGVAIYGPGSVTNLSGGSIAATNGNAIYISGPGNVYNAGTVTASGTAISVVGASVTNQQGGTISGGAGLIFSGTGTFSNAGVVIGTGGNAVTFSHADATNRLIDYASSSIIGNVDGGTGVLELGTGNGTPGTLAGIGTGITNFGSLQFDPNVAWTVSGEVGSNGFDTIAIGGFKANDAIDITNFAAISETFGSNGLVLSDGTTQTTLAIQGNFSTGDFKVTSDGSSASYISLQDVPNSFTWTGGSADWNSGANWNPVGVPGMIDDVTIDTTGTDYTVSIASSEFADANNVTLNASNATLEVDGTLAATGTVTITAGTLAAKGSLSAASITDDAVLSFIGDHTISATPLQLAGTLQVQDIDVATPATLTIDTGEVITQTGTTAVITSTTLNGERIVNNGSISAAVANGTLTIAPLNFTNNGTISVAAGEALTIGGAWDNSTGVIDLSSSVDLTLAGEFTTGGIGSITSMASVTVAGSLDNTGSTLEVGTGTELGAVTLVDTAIISNGTIIDDGNGFVFDSGTFSGVTFQGPLNLANYGDQLNIANGLTMAGDGNINLTGGGDTILNFANSQTIDNATINLNGTDGSNPLTEIDIQGALHSVLTVGSNVAVTSTVANARADIRSTSSNQTGVINLGTIIAAASNGSFSITPFDGFTNQGSISIDNNEFLSIQPGFGIFDNSGTVTVDGRSTLQILSSGSNTPPISNTGSITLAAGTTLELGGYYTEASLGNVDNQGTTKIDGTFDAAHGTLTLGPGTVLDHVLLAGNMRNGTIVSNDDLTVAPGSSASLRDVIYEGPLRLTGDGTGLTINENVIVTDNTGSQPGTIDVSGMSDTLMLQNSDTAASRNQTLNNVTINIGNSTASDALNAILPNGTLNVGAGATIESKTAGAKASFLAGASSTINFGGTLNASGAGGTFTLLGGGASRFNNNGLLFVGNGDTLSVATAIASGTGTIDIATGGVANFATSVATGQTLAFTDTTGRLVLHQPGSFAATVLGFANGNTIDLASITADAAGWSAGQLTISNAGTMVAMLSLPEDYSATDFTVATDHAGGSAVTITATCYAAGTRILTPAGEIAIERLHEGDLVLTVSGRAQPICWLGHRRVDFRRHPNRQRVLPVRVAAHAFGMDRPKRDLLLSPDHAVFVEDVLIPIRHLINGSTITQINRRAVTYYHIELSRHDVLLAEGLPAESYLEAGARDAFANGGGVMQLHPDFTPPSDHYAMLWELHGYAPLVVAGEVLGKVRRTLATQARLAA